MSRHRPDWKVATNLFAIGNTARLQRCYRGLAPLGRCPRLLHFVPLALNRRTNHLIQGAIDVILQFIHSLTGKL